jgi:hypothetical protein
MGRVAGVSMAQKATNILLFIILTSSLVMANGEYSKAMRISWIVLLTTMPQGEESAKRRPS